MLWRLREPEVQAEYQSFVKERRADVKSNCVEEWLSPQWDE